MTVRDEPTAKGQVVPRSRWRFTDGLTVALEGGFEPGRIYDVMYKTSDPRVLGCGLAGTRDLISFLKYDDIARQSVAGIEVRDRLGRVTKRPLPPALRLSGLQRRRAADARCSTASSTRSAALAVDRSIIGSARRRAMRCNSSTSSSRWTSFRSPTAHPPIRKPARSTACSRARLRRTPCPKLFHLLTNSEYFNRAGSLVHTDPTGTKDAELPPTTRVYMIASAPHGPGPFPPASNTGGGMVGRAALNPLDYRPAVRALFRALDRWVVEDTRAAPKRVSENRGRNADVSGPGWLARHTGLPAATATAPRVSPEFRSGLGQGDRQRRPARGGQTVRLRCSGGRRGRQRSRRHPAARHRRSARDPGRLELPPRVNRRSGSAGG